MPIKEGVLFKKIKMPDLKQEFNKLSKEMASHFKNKRIVPQDISEAIKWARKR